MKNKNTFVFGRNSLLSGQRPQIKLKKLLGGHNVSQEREEVQMAIADLNIKECSIQENN